MIKNKAKKIGAVNKNKGQSPAGTVPYFLLIALYIILYPVFSFAEGLDPYSHNPLNELQAEFKPSLLPPVLRTNQAQRQDLPDSAPQTPAMVTDADGNKMLYQDGKLLVKIDLQGNQTFYSKGMPAFEKDDTGYLTRTYEYSGARATIKNEWGETVGHQEFGLGGLFLRGYDEKGRLTQKYEYEGRRIKAMVDALTNSRTLYNDRGKAEKELNFLGEVTTTYYYNDNNKLIYKINNIGSKTVYDNQGRPQFTYRDDGLAIETYNWVSRNRYSITDEYGHTTYYDHDRQQYETQKVETPEGVVTRNVKTYTWQGTKLISSLDIDREETTYYENGRPTETIYNGYLVGLWKYDVETGILICKATVTRPDGKLNIDYYDHGRMARSYTLSGNEFDRDDFNSYNYKPLYYDEITALVRQYKDTNHSIADDIDTLWKNGQAYFTSETKGKGNEGVEQVPPADNGDNGRHVGPPEETPPNAPPEIPDGQDDEDDEDDGPGRHVGPPEN